nr:hypothetical protein [Acidobacteriota bacterium]
MKFQLDVADKPRTVDVRRQPQGYRVVVDNRVHLVDAVRVGPHTWSLIVRDDEKSSARSVEVVVVPRNGNGAFDVYLDGYHI